jgi:hypothetical protein
MDGDVGCDAPRVVAGEVASWIAAEPDAKRRSRRSYEDGDYKVYRMRIEQW